MIDCKDGDIGIFQLFLYPFTITAFYEKRLLMPLVLQQSSIPTTRTMEVGEQTEYQNISQHSIFMI